MTLKDRLTDALNSTPADNDRRIATLRAVLEAAEKCKSDGEVLAAVSRIIFEREQKAASFNMAGQAELAKNEREEIDFLRSFLRVLRAAEPAVAAKTAKPKTPVETPKSGSGKPVPIVSRTQIVFAAIAGGIVLLAVAFYFFVVMRGSNEEILMANGEKPKIAVFKDDHTLGSPNAPIIMLEYAAPSCPHCATFNNTVMPQIKKKYIDSGKIFYIYRVFPIMPADGAAEALARCLPADNYFRFLDLLYRNQPKWDPEYGVTDVRGGLIQMASIVGMSVERFDQCISNKDEQDRINRIAQDGDTKYSIPGVPFFVIDGVVVKNGEATTWPALQVRFDSLLSKH